MPLNPQRVQALFLAAVEQPEPERAAFVHREAGGDAELRQRVDALLHAHADPEAFLSSLSGAARLSEGGPEHTGVGSGRSAYVGFSAVRASESLFAALLPPVRPDELILDRYRIGKKLGEGGMGAVYQAEQLEPVRRTVAFKVMQPGPQSAQLLARFEAERQSLALMDHPNIAKVLDAGAVPRNGAPFFIMELVAGQPITEYCDAKRLNPSQRIDLFIQVCHGVQYAHQKGIIHRDLKPGNILVAEYDGRPVPKIIDFGIAKATGPLLTMKTLATSAGAVEGAPEYMSPEQADPSVLDIDTRSDIYALGVILYELLTGTPPFDRRTLADAGLLELLRVIREEEPPKPSTKLSTVDVLPAVAAQRGLKPKQLTKQLRGDLDWIVMKALAKERERRYDSANGFAADLQRYLANEPVQAGPPSRGYRLRKFFRRNRTAVVAAGLGLLALVLGLVIALAGWAEARHQQAYAVHARDVESKQRQRAEQAAQAERDARTLSDERLAQLKKGNEILGDIFFGLSPREIAESGKPLAAVLGDRLEKAAEALEGEAVGDVLTVAAMQTKLGNSLMALGEARKAVSLFRKSYVTYTTLLGPEHEDTLKPLNSLAVALMQDGHTQQALPYLERLVTLRERVHGPDHEYLANTLEYLGSAYGDLGRYADAVATLRKARAIRIRTLPADDQKLLVASANLAGAMMQAGQANEAIPLFEEVRAGLAKRLKPDHPDLLKLQNNLAAAYEQVGRLPEAFKLLEETLAAKARVLGAEHPDTLYTQAGLAVTLLKHGRAKEAVPLLEKVRAVQRRKQGENHPGTLNTLYNLASAQRAAGDLAKSLASFTELRDRVKQSQGEGHPEHIYALFGLGRTYLDQNQPGEALVALAEAVKWVEKGKYEHPEAARILRSLADLLEEEVKLVPAEGHRRKVLELTTTQKGDAATVAEARARLGRNLALQFRWADAEPLLREALAVLEAMGPDDWFTFEVKSWLGETLMYQAKEDQAEPLLLAGQRGLAERAAKAPDRVQLGVIQALQRLVTLYERTNRPAEAAKWRKALDEAARRRDQGSSP